MSKAREYLQRLDEEFEASAEGYGFQLRLDFAEILWCALKQHGWSQTQFAKKSGWPDSFVSNLVHANQNCELDTIGKAFHILGVKAQLRITQESHACQLQYVDARITGTKPLSPNTTEVWQDGEESQEENKLKYWDSETVAPNQDVFREGSVSGGFSVFDLPRCEVVVG